MKSVKPIACLVLVMLLVGSLACQALAERPQIREIRDQFMWGDPDEPAGCRQVGVWQEVVMESPDCEIALTRLVPRSAAPQEAPTLRVNMTLLGLEVGWGHDPACRTRAVRR